MELFRRTEDGTLGATVEEGNKRVRITIHEVLQKDWGGVVSTEVSNIDGQPKVPGTTTAVYRHVKKILIEVSKSMGKPLRYCFRTRYQKMEDWADDSQRGRSIFPWNNFRGGSTTSSGDCLAEILIKPDMDSDM